MLLYMQKIIIGLLVAVLVIIIYYTYYIMPQNSNTILGLSLNETDQFGVNFSSGAIGSTGINGEGFMSPIRPESKMGAYSDIKLNNDDKIKYDKLYHVYNESSELIEVPSPCDSYECKFDMVPSVDGTEGAPKSASIFKFNKSSPECCPSTYSTSSGCVCMTKEQKQYIGASRGNNV